MTVALVASAGGHLHQLRRLFPDTPFAHEDRFWITYANPQSRSMLAGEDVHWLPTATHRDLAGVIANLPRAYSVLRRQRVSAVVSTGAQIAVSAMLPARLLGIPCHYIESATRVDGPSLTGRMLARVPGVHCFTQYEWPNQPGWEHFGNVFDAYRTEPRGATSKISRALITAGIGTTRSFSALGQTVLSILPADVEVVNSAGDPYLRGEQAHSADTARVAPYPIFRDSLRQVDVVVAHAGVGSALAALEAGHCPIIIPRRAHRNEHIDDHQVQLAEELDRRGLAVVSSLESLSLEHFRTAYSRRAVPVNQLPSESVESKAQAEP